MPIHRARRLRSEAIRLLKEANETMQRSQAILEQSRGFGQTLKASSNGRNQNGARKPNYKKLANNARDHSMKAKNSSAQHVGQLTKMLNTAISAAESAQECKRGQEISRKDRLRRGAKSGS